MKRRDKRRLQRLRDSLDLSYRDAAEHLTTRALTLRAGTANDEERSIQGTVSTESVVTVMDWRRGEAIDEILLAEGATFPSQLPLLDNHNRYSSLDVLGSARDFTRNGGEWQTKAFFVRGDAEVDRIWSRTQQGHLTDFSVGYRVLEATTIPAEMLVAPE